MQHEIMTNNSDKRILVTGGSGGIGSAIATRLAADGYDVLVHYRANPDRAAQVAEQISQAGGRAATIGFDVCDREAVRTLLEQDIADNGAYYGVICNAGLHRDSAFPMMSGDDWDDVLRANLDAFYNVLQPVSMHMVRRRAPGRIIAISSISGIAGNRGQVNYSAAKAGLIGAVRALGIELAKRKITVNCVAPGVIETDMTANLPHEDILKMIPMQRLGTADEVAAVVSFLCSPDASYMTRQVLTVDGGMI